MALEDNSDLYQSDIFSSLHYSDLKYAHENSIIPVGGPGESIFKTTEELKKYRQIEDLKNIPFNETESLNILREKENNMDKNAVARAYYYAKKTEESERLNKLLLSKMHYIESSNMSKK